MPLARFEEADAEVVSRSSQAQGGQRSMDTMTRRRNIADTLERWQKAVVRAIAQGIVVRQTQCGIWIATSGADADGAYVVTVADCECRAASEGDPICKHRAALRVKLGILEAPRGPAPAGPAAVVVVAPTLVDVIEEAEAIAATEAARLEAEEAAELDRIGTDYEAYLDQLERTRKCPVCNGSGEIRMQTGGRFDQYWAARCSCHQVAA